MPLHVVEHARLFLVQRRNRYVQSMDFVEGITLDELDQLGWAALQAMDREPSPVVPEPIADQLGPNPNPNPNPDADADAAEPDLAAVPDAAVPEADEEVNWSDSTLHPEEEEEG